MYFTVLPRNVTEKKNINHDKKDHFPFSGDQFINGL